MATLAVAMPGCLHILLPFGKSCPSCTLIAVFRLFLRFLPFVARFLRLREYLSQVEIVRGDAFAQGAKDGDVVGEPARDGFAVGQADIAVHFWAAGGEA